MRAHLLTAAAPASFLSTLVVSCPGLRGQGPLGGHWAGVCVCVCVCVCARARAQVQVASQKRGLQGWGWVSFWRGTAEAWG